MKQADRVYDTETAAMTRAPQKQAKTTASKKAGTKRAGSKQTKETVEKPAPTKKPARKRAAAIQPATKKVTAPIQGQSETVVLLSGGNPQIAKGDGDAPVQAYIAAMPGWKSELGRRLDALIAHAVPEVQKGVHWNSPFYGMHGKGWFMSFHCFTRYVKVAFLFGRALEPLPPGASKDPNARYLDIYEDQTLDEQQFSTWVRQASRGQGWIP